MLKYDYDGRKTDNRRTKKIIDAWLTIFKTSSEIRSKNVVWCANHKNLKIFQIT